MHDTAPDSQPCTLCHRPARDRVHDGCRQHLADHLRALPALYEALADQLQPGRRGNGGGRPATRTAPVPVPLAVLDLRSRGGIEGVLRDWEASVRDLLDWAPAPARSVQQTVHQAARFLLLNLDWIADHHPAVDDMAREIAHLRRQAEQLCTGEQQERRVTVACATDGCDGRLHVTISTPGARCPHCQTQYGHAEVLRLPLAARTAA